MKKCIGSGIMNTFLAIGFPVFVVLLFGESAFFIVFDYYLHGVFSPEATMFGVFGFIGTLFVFYMIAIRARGLEQYYGIGYFDEKGFTVKIPFMRKKYIEYTNCKKLGIAYYVHGIGRPGETDCGTYCFYIFFTYGTFDEKYRSRINRWRLTKTNAKIGFNKEL